VAGLFVTSSVESRDVILHLDMMGIDGFLFNL